MRLLLRAATRDAEERIERLTADRDAQRAAASASMADLERSGFWSASVLRQTTRLRLGADQGERDGLASSARHCDGRTVALSGRATCCFSGWPASV